MLNPHSPESRTKAVESLVAFLGRLPMEKSWVVTVDRHVKARTDPQNRALFGVAYPPLVEATGATLKELHHEMCCRFFGATIIDIGGKSVTRPYRTTTTDENGKRDVLPWDRFSEFYSSVQQLGAEYGVYIPDPEPNIPEHAR